MDKIEILKCNECDKWGYFGHSIKCECGADVGGGYEADMIGLDIDKAGKLLEELDGHIPMPGIFVSDDG